jgi:hypothetical protein
MPALRRLVLRFVNFILPGRGERQLDREIGDHLAMLEDEFERRGLRHPEAAKAARRVLGDTHRIKEAHRDARSFVWLEDARRDVRYAVRTLMRAPGFTVLACLTLAVGIGSVTIIYSVIHDRAAPSVALPRSRAVRERDDC